jgi:NAD(P)H dehydrogenase (quinone)
MSKIVISGASGDIARRTTKCLLEKVDPRSLTLVTRDPASLQDMVALGATVCRGDYRDPASLDAAYAGADVLMLISGHAVAKRIPEHRNAIAAAKKAGIQHIVYTSVAGVHPRNPTISAGDHIVTERDLHESGLGFTLLRDQTYSEIFTMMAQAPLQTGKWLQIGDQGSISPVSKDDVARCAAVCLMEPERHARVTYEITGPELMTFREIAQMFATLYDRPIEYVKVTPELMYAQFDAMGVPRGFTEGAKDPLITYGSEEVVTAAIAFDEDYHAILSHHVEFITGRKPRSLLDVSKAEKAARA